MPLSPYDQIAGLISGNSKEAAFRHAKNNFLESELGTIVNGLKLKLDRFPDVIDEYFISDHLCTNYEYDTEIELDKVVTGEHTHPTLPGPSGAHLHPHVHHIRQPWSKDGMNGNNNALRKLQDGDRVLVNAVNGGQSFVVVARLKTNKDIPTT